MSTSPVTGGGAGCQRDLGPLVGALEVNEVAVKFTVFAANTAELVTYHTEGLSPRRPRPGCVEQDAEVLINLAVECMKATVDNLQKLNGKAQH